MKGIVDNALPKPKLHGAQSANQWKAKQKVAKCLIFWLQ
jgi:hypothetical protein